MLNLTPVLTDAPTLRARVHAKVVSALSETFPLDLKGRSLEVKDLQVHAKDYSPEDQRRAILEGKSLHEVVKGTLVLKGTDGKVIDEAKNFTLVHVPYFTERHTVISKGNEYQVANMLRRKPGVYTQRGENGELHTVFNLSKGQNFNVHLNPEKGTLYLNYKTTNLPLYPVLRELGSSHEDIVKGLGKGVAEVNERIYAGKTTQTINKLYQKLVHPLSQKADATHADKARAVREKYTQTAMDPEVTHHTLGERFDKVTPNALLVAAKKLLDVHNNKAEVDDSDSLAFKTFHSVDDFLGERLRLTARDWKQKARYALHGKDKIREALRPAPFSDSVDKFITTSPLTAVPTGINPIELLDHAVKVTALGEGGIPSERAIPYEARLTHPTHYGTIDPIRTPESGNAGVDLRISIAAHRDDHGNLYTPVIDVKTKKTFYLKSGDLVKKVVAFPHQELKGMVDAFVGGQVRKVPASQVDYQIPHLAYALSPSTALIPMLHNIQGNRAIMGAKMQTQGLPLVHREVPLVQVKSHIGQRSFEDVFGHMVVPTSPVKGIVEKIENGFIHIRPDAKAKTAYDEQAETFASELSKYADFSGDTVTENHKPKNVHYAVTPWGADDPDDDTDEKTAAAKIEPKDTGLIRVPYQDNFPFPSKTFLHHDISVKPGERVEAGQKLADSNFTRQGTLALGTNLRIAYMPYMGLNSNDAVVISAGAARKLTSDHMYREIFPITAAIELSREKHRTFFGGKYAPQQYAGLDTHGIIQKGAKIHHKDLLVVGLVKNSIQGADALLGRISKQLTRPYREVILQWEHNAPGEVVEVVRTDSQVTILVKTHEQMQIGDKLCYDEQTDVLTREGWKPIYTVNMNDEVATLEGDRLVYARPSAVHSYAEGGRMYRLDTQQVDLFVTEAHKMYVQLRDKASYELIEARAVAGKRVRYRKDADWDALTPGDVVLPALRVAAGQGGRGERLIPERRLPAATYAMLLGAFVTEGNLVEQPESGSYGIDITQVKPGFRAKLLAALKSKGIAYSEHGRGTKVRVYSKQLLEHFRPLGAAHEKYLPPFVFEWDRATLRVLFEWMMWGDGHSEDGSPIAYTTTSPQLADDMQRLCLHVGKAGNIKRKHIPVQKIKGRTYACKPRYDVRIVNTKLRPEVNHGHARTQHGQTEEWMEDYAAPVYCVTVPSGVLYIRRNGKPVWSGNSGRYGNKGVVAKIIPDHEMLKDEHGNVIDAVFTSAGVVSRINPAQIIETAVSKVADKTGKPIIYDNANPHNAVKWAKDLLKKHGIKDREFVHDPVSGRTITGDNNKGVLVGKQYVFKLFKSTDTNFSGHAVGPYDVNEQPVKVGGEESAKGLGKMEFDALLAHNARNVINEAANIKGQRNDEFWRSLQLGLPLPAAKPSFAFHKFTAMLEGAGVKVDKRDSKFRLLPLTDQDILKRSTGAIANSKTVIAKNLKPETGGLFDPRLTGGPQGTLYSHIDLHEPVVNPVFMEPVRRLLGMTEKTFEATHAEKGGAWFRQELARMDVPRKLKELRNKIKLSKGAELNDLVKQVKYLESLQREGLKPHDAYVLSKIPVVPPAFRPIVAMPNDPTQLMVADANKLYAHLMDVNHAVKLNVLPSAAPKYRGALYNAVGAVFGTHDVEDEELKGQAVKGFLTQVSGKNSPKGGFFQRKLMFRTQDVSGRGTIVPDGALHMNQIGLPEDMLWKMLDRMIVARLVRTGYDALSAREQTDKRTPVAREAMLSEVKERPFIFNRAPTLHRYSMVSAYAVPVHGKTIRMNPFAEVGLNADYDGDTLQIHTPVTAGAVEDTKKMLLSNLLLSDQSRNKLMVMPRMESVMGITQAASSVHDPNQKVRVFGSKEELLTAYRKGEVKLTDHVEVKTTKTAEDDGDDFREEIPWTEKDALACFPPETVSGLWT